MKTMNGFFILLKLDPDYKTVKAHEKTLTKPKADRLNLMRACYANLEPIQLMYMDQNDTIRKTMDAVLDKPLIKVKSYEGFTHRLWQLEDPKSINIIIDEIKDKILFIADGHHRYQTSINYAEEKKEQTGNRDPNAPFNYIMIVLCNMFDPGLSILPTYRLIKMSNVKQIGKSTRTCRRCNTTRGIIRRYGIMICRRCAYETLSEIDFKRYN